MAWCTPSTRRATTSRACRASGRSTTSRATIDLAVIAGGDPLEGLADVCARRPTFVMMFAAGFAESGEEGAAAQARIAELVRSSGVFLLGPNTTLNSFLPMRADGPGPRIGLISHSGHQGRHLWQGEEIGVPLGYWAPTGNEVDLEFADFVRFFADQPEIGAIAAYIEGFKDGRTVVRAADYALRRGTPIAIVKVGRSAAGEANAMSHTAHLAGSDGVATGGVPPVRHLTRREPRRAAAHGRLPGPGGGAHGARRRRLRHLGRHAGAPHRRARGAGAGRAGAGAGDAGGAAGDHPRVPPGVQPRRQRRRSERRRAGARDPPRTSWPIPTSASSSCRSSPTPTT